MSWLALDEQEDGFGWSAEERLRRTSHVLRVDGRVWLVDPLDAPELEGRVRALGEPAAVLQLLDRHSRGCRAWADRLGVPLRRAWEGVADAPFQTLPVCDNRLWREVALWEPRSRTLLCGDALGTGPFFLAGDERIGVHPLLRLRPPRSLGGVAPDRVLVGHGGGLHVDATAAVREALATAHRRLPRAVVGGISAARGGSAASR